MHALPDPDRHAEFYADVPLKRGLAWIVDTILIGLVTALIVVLTALVALFFLPLVFLAVSFAYRAASIANWSATPGMWIAAIEFRNSAGNPLTRSEALGHTIVYTVALAFVLPQILSALLMLMGPRGQGLGDHVLGTVAINRAAAG